MHDEPFINILTYPFRTADPAGRPYEGTIDAEGMTS